MQTKIGQHYGPCV